MKNFSNLIRILFLVGFVCSALFSGAPAALAKDPPDQAETLPMLSTPLYNTGSPALTDIWVDAVNGNDANNGSSPSAAFRTLTAAWDTIPINTTLSQGVRINLQPGNYTAAMIPNYWESRHGTFTAPIFIHGNGTTRAQVVLQGNINVYDTRYIYFENLSIIHNGDSFHCELCDHLLLRNMVFNGGAQQAQEAIKINQSQYVYIEKSDVSGAWDNAIDFVAVQYGHIMQNRIHNTGDWCAYTKGGSAYLSVEANIIYNCGTGGFTAGQGTGFQFMTPPWIQYEAYDIKVINNVIHDAEGAGLGVNGGYNILMAYNTLYRVGSRDHVLEAVFGSRSCDGIPGDPGRERCGQYLVAGGWGTTVVDDGTNAINIPNKNVFIYNNIVYNPAGFQSLWSHFAIYEPRSNPNDASNSGPNPARADENLQIKGNIIWNGPTSMPLGIEDTLACANSNPTCNQAQLFADNQINTVQPQFISPSAENFHPTGNWTTTTTVANIPDFTWDISGVPAGNNSNAVTIDFENANRLTKNLPGAYITTYTISSTSFSSTAAQDGWILESNETSNLGGNISLIDATLRLGDDAARKQYRSILSFTTGSLPDTAVITAVTLKIKQSGLAVNGATPTMFQGFLVDVRKGFFGATASLQTDDFQASVGTAAEGKAGIASAPTVTSGWYTFNLTAAAKAYINKVTTGNGLTQFRLRFKLDDNNNTIANYLSFYSGNSATNKPILTIQYYVP